MIAEITARQGQLASLCERYGVLRLDLLRLGGTRELQLRGQ